MRKIIFILCALAILAALHFTGFILSNNITHPFWNVNATLFGGIGGAILALLIVWASNNKQRLAKFIASMVNIVFIMSVIITVYFAKRFINAENYDAFAADIWHWGSYAVIGSFVPQVTQLLTMVFSKR